MPDLIVALYPDAARANRVRTELFRAGFATDRVDVTSTADPGPAAVIPLRAGERRYDRYFRALLAGSDLNKDAAEIAQRVEGGEAAVVIHPRGRVELEQADAILQKNDAQLIRRDVHESLRPTPVIGEHAAGKS